MDLFEPLKFEFMQKALVGGLAVAAVCAVIGVFIVQRGLAFLGDGLAHAAFGGIAIGLYMGASVENAVWIAIPFTAAIALGIGFVLRRTSLRGDVATGVFFSFSFALGVLFLGLRTAQDRPVQLENLLFGNMLLVTDEVLKVVVIVSIAGFLLTIALWSRLAYAIFDPELAAISGVPVAILEYLLLATTAVVVVVSVKTVGVVLVSSFVVIPAATARLVGSTLARTTGLSVLISTIGTVFGLIASFHWRTPSAATIILIHSASFALALGWSRLKR
ncbi:MAG: metal ABC transporter permease [Myxococcota bacterium]|nr:metal ABC transporter permease [Deltaproteobacteria bacterium]MDQ3334475.1 metal ABC transporter permease [Myxococcota bacterium]